MAQPTTNRYRFGPYVLDEDDRRITCGDKVIHLQPKDFDVLLFLLKRNGQLVSKQAIKEAVWGDVVVTENSLTRSILQIRMALGDNTDPRLYIETIPRLGYRLICDVKSLSDSSHSTKQFSTRIAMGVGAFAVVVVAVVLGLYQSGSNSTLGETDIPVTIAILPFTDMSESQDQSYLGNGLAEQLTTALGNIRGLGISSRTSAFALSELGLDVQSIGDALNVKYVLESSVIRDGDRIRITTQLINTQTGSHIWAEEYDRDFNNIFDLLDEVTSDLTQALKVQLFQEEPTLRLANTGTESVAAFNYKMLADEARRGLPDTFDQIIAYYDQAIELDPDYISAYVNKAWVYGRLLEYGYDISPKEAYATALAILEEAQRHDWRETGEWERGKRIFDLENTTAQQIREMEVRNRNLLISYHDTGRPQLGGYAGYSVSLLKAGLFHTARAYIEKFFDPLTPGAKLQLVQMLGAGGGTQGETLDLYSDLIATGEAGPVIVGSKARLLYKMNRAEEAEELITEFDAGVARDWPESIAALFGAAYLDEPLSVTMLEFTRNDLPRAAVGAAYLISAGYIDEGLGLLERGVADADVSNREWLLRIRPITSATWREDVKQEMMANQRFQNILDSIGVGEDWKYEHARRAMSLTPITGVEVDPRDLNIKKLD